MQRPTERTPGRPANDPGGSSVDREALERKLEALVQDVRANPPLAAEEPNRPVDNRAQYEYFPLPATAGRPVSEGLKVVLGRGVDPRADPTVMAKRSREGDGSGRVGKGHGAPALEVCRSQPARAWKIAVVLGVVLTAGFGAVLWVWTFPGPSSREAGKARHAVEQPPIAPVPVAPSPSVASFPAAAVLDAPASVPPPARPNPPVGAPPSRPGRTGKASASTPRMTPVGGPPEY
jgi:hypothetical protein